MNLKGEKGMFFKKNLFLAVIFLGLIYEIYILFHTAYIMSPACPVWDSTNKVCRLCNYPEPVRVNVLIPNHCSDRKIIKEQHCNNIQSVPKEYIEKKQEGLFVSCKLDRTITRIQNTRSIIFIFGLFLCLILIAFKKSRWFGVCVFSALSSFVVFSEFFDCWTSPFCHVINSLPVVIGAGFIALLPICVITIDYFNKKKTRKKLLQQLCQWFLILCIPLLISCGMFPIEKDVLVILVLWFLILWRLVWTDR